MKYLGLTRRHWWIFFTNVHYYIDLNSSYLIIMAYVIIADGLEVYSDLIL